MIILILNFLSFADSYENYIIFINFFSNFSDLLLHPRRIFDISVQCELLLDLFIK